MLFRFACNIIGTRELTSRGQCAGAEPRRYGKVHTTLSKVRNLDDQMSTTSIFTGIAAYPFIVRHLISKKFYSPGAGHACDAEFHNLNGSTRRCRGQVDISNLRQVSLAFAATQNNAPLAICAAI